MKCHFCIVCTITDHAAEIKRFCPDFSAEDFTCPICLEIVFKPMLTDPATIFSSACYACLMKIKPNHFSPRLALPNYPLRNQLNVFLGKAGLVQDYKVIPGGLGNPELEMFRDDTIQHTLLLQQAVNEFMEFLNDFE
jgi:hypothetical protein